MTLLPAAGYRRAEPATAVTGSSTPALSWPAPNASRPAALSGPALEVVDTDTLAALRHDAQEGRKVAAAAKAQKIEAAVDEALRLGKIAPSRRRHWVTLCTHDEGCSRSSPPCRRCRAKGSVPLS